jgi:hypothetical protein
MTGWNRFIRLDPRIPRFRQHRKFNKREHRVFCPCELCALSHGRLLYPAQGGFPLRWRRIHGFTTNFPPVRLQYAWPRLRRRCGG